VVAALIDVARHDLAFGNRQAAVGALGLCTTEAPIAARALLEVLRLDESACVRADAARALSGLPRASTTAAAPALLAALQDEDEEVRSAAAIALKFVPLPAPTNRVGKAILEAAKRHPNEDVRSQLDVVVKRLARSQRKRRTPPQPRPPR
jgi:HEAT repeat protein